MAIANYSPSVRLEVLEFKKVELGAGQKDYFLFLFTYCQIRRLSRLVGKILGFIGPVFIKNNYSLASFVQNIYKPQLFIGINCIGLGKRGNNSRRSYVLRGTPGKLKNSSCLTQNPNVSVDGDGDDSGKVRFNPFSKPIGFRAESPFRTRVSPNCISYLIQKINIGCIGIGEGVPFPILVYGLCSFIPDLEYSLSGEDKNPILVRGQ